MWDLGVIRVLFSCFHMVLAVLFLVMLVCSLELVDVFYVKLLRKKLMKHADSCKGEILKWLCFPAQC